MALPLELAIQEAHDVARDRWEAHERIADGLWWLFAALGLLAALWAWRKV